MLTRLRELDRWAERRGLLSQPHPLTVRSALVTLIVLAFVLVALYLLGAPMGLVTPIAAAAAFGGTFGSWLSHRGRKP